MATHTNKVPRLGWIGTGVMGQAMCGHLLAAGYAVSVFTRTRSKAASLLDRGATWCTTPAEVAARSDIVCSIVGFPDDVREVHLSDAGTLAAARPGMMIIDLTTSEPSLAVEIARRAGDCGAEALDAPVSGGDVGARNGTLSIMVGGDRATFDAALPILQVFGKTIVFQGPPGSGQHTKMVNQILIASNMIGVCEALLYGYRAGLNLEHVMQSVSSGAAGSWSLANLGPRILQNQFDPGFFVDHFVKDMRVALDEARRLRLALPGLALAHQLYVALQAQGGGQLGTHALQLALGQLSHIDWCKRCS